MKKSLLTLAIIVAIVSSLTMMCFAIPTAVETFDDFAEYVPLTEENESVLYAEFDGEGTENSPYMLYNAEDFVAFSQNINAGIGNEAYYALGCDVDFNGAVFTPIGTKDAPFKGTFNGNGFTVKNINVTGKQYVGLFGYIRNATVKNFYIDDVTVTLLSSSETTTYVGSVVGYIYGQNANALISEVCVDEFDLNVSGITKYVYVGSVAGYANSATSGSAKIENCYSRCNVTLENNNGYGYVGGIAGYLEIYSGGDTLLTKCYNVGSVSSTSKNSSYAGGLVGYIKSHGSSYSPDVVSLSSEDAELYASDVDFMLSHCFAVANVSSKSLKYKSLVGRLIGNNNTNSDCDSKTTVYPIASQVSGIVVISPSSETVLGSATAFSNLKDKSYLTTNLLWDFENVWTFDETGDYEYPVFFDVERTYDSDISLDLLEVSTDMKISSDNSVVMIETLNAEHDNSLYFGRGTYVINNVSGDFEITADPNANIIVLGANKPKGYVELDIGSKSAESAARYAEVNGFQYVIHEYENKYGVIAADDMLVEIIEKKNENSVKSGSSYYHISSENGTCKKLSLDNYINSYDETVIRLKDPVGIRFRSDISKLAKVESEEFEIVEYGYIFALKSDEQLNFSHSRYVSGVAYDSKNNVDIVFDNSDDEVSVFTGVLFNIPENRYKETIVSKTYTKILVDGKEYCVYGEEMSSSLYDVAKMQENNSALTSEQKAIVDNILKHA